MADADDSSSAGLSGASSGPSPHFTAPPQTATDATAAFLEEASLREDQIQNAVAFLSHPKVRGSTVSAKRSFLEKKGLTSAEIDEACKRVPEAPAAAALAPSTAAVPATTATPTYGANNLVTYTQQQPAHAVPASQALATQPAQPGGLVPLQQQHMTAVPPQPVRWSQVVLGLGVAAASLYGLHQLLAPRITAWSHQLSAARTAAHEAEAARTAALTAALQSLSEGQQKLLHSVEGLTATLQQQQQQQRPGSSQAVRGMGGSAAYGGPGEAQSSISFHQQRATYEEQARCQSPGAASAASAGMASSQRQQQQQQQQQHSSNVRGWDAYADPSRGAAIRSAGYSGPGYSSASNYSQSQQQQQEGAASSVGGAAQGFEVVPRDAQPASEAMWGASSSNGPAPAGTAVAPQAQQGARRDEAPHSAAFHEVMEMVRAGKTPPNVRTDIDDSPPDPDRPISAPQLAPRGKPWERSSRPAANGGSPPLSAMGDNFFQQQQQRQQQPAYDGYTNFGMAAEASSYAAPPPAAAAVAGPGGSSSNVADVMEAAAASSHRKSMEQAGAAYDFSHLLGYDPSSSSEAPWTPPPPPAPTIIARPGSSGSSSSRAGAGAALPAGGAAAEVAGAARSSSVEQLVAGVAASAVQNVVAASEAAASQGAEAALA